MTKRAPSTYWIVPEYKRDAKRSTGAFFTNRVRYAIHACTFPAWHRSGIIKNLDNDLSLAQAQRKLKSWRAWQRKRDRERQ